MPFSQVRNTVPPTEGEDSCFHRGANWNIPHKPLELAFAFTRSLGIKMQVNSSMSIAMQFSFTAN